MSIVLMLPVVGLSSISDSVADSGQVGEMSPFKKRNIITFNFVDIAFTDFTLNYERLVGQEGQFGLIGGFTYGVNTRKKPEYDFENLYNVNFGANFYPFKHGIWKYFIGVSVKAGFAEFSKYLYVWKTNPEYVYVDNNYFYMKYYANNGFEFSFTDGFYFSCVVQMGTKYYYHSMSDGLKPSVNLTVNFGIRF